MTETDINADTNAGAAGDGWDEAAAWEETLIQDLRANGGRASDGPLKGQPIIVLYSIGAKSGERRRSILTVSHDGDDFVVAGTAGGSPTLPSWVANLEAHPDIEYEFGDTTYTARADVIRDGPERDRLWEQHVKELPNFAAYPEQTGRVIPVVRLTRTGTSAG